LVAGPAKVFAVAGVERTGNKLGARSCGLLYSGQARRRKLADALRKLKIPFHKAIMRIQAKRVARANLRAAGAASSNL
jgi:hypothetical protein